jgi:hypothetical protein
VAAAQQKAKVDEAQKALDALLAKLSPAAPPAGDRGLEAAPPAGIQLEDLRQVDRLLSEARGTFIPPAR